MFGDSFFNDQIAKITPALSSAARLALGQSERIIARLDYLIDLQRSDNSAYERKWLRVNVLSGVRSDSIADVPVNQEWQLEAVTIVPTGQTSVSLFANSTDTAFPLYSVSGAVASSDGGNGVRIPSGSSLTVLSTGADCAVVCQVRVIRSQSLSNAAGAGQVQTVDKRWDIEDELERNARHFSQTDTISQNPIASGSLAESMIQPPNIDAYDASRTVE